MGGLKRKRRLRRNFFFFSTCHLLERRFAELRVCSHRNRHAVARGHTLSFCGELSSFAPVHHALVAGALSSRALRRRLRRTTMASAFVSNFTKLYEEAPRECEFQLLLSILDTQGWCTALRASSRAQLLI